MDSTYGGMNISRLRMVKVRSDVGIDPGLTASVSHLVQHEVIPGLRRTVGDGLVLPETIRLAAKSHGDGHVPVRVNPTTWEIVSVDEPVVCATENRDRLRYALAHEIAHYHELSLRNARRMRVPGVGATQLWSEYYAQRVSWESGIIQPESWLAACGGEGVVETRPRNGEAYSWAYMLTFTLAHADACPETWLELYPGKEDYLRATIGVWHQGGVADRLFRLFPNWSKADVDLTSMVFKGLMKFSRKHRPK